MAETHLSMFCVLVLSVLEGESDEETKVNTHIAINVFLYRNRSTFGLFNPLNVPVLSPVLPIQLS